MAKVFNPVGTSDSTKRIVVIRACKELGIPLRTIRRDFADELDEKIFVIETNLYRRHLNEFQKSEMVKSLEGIESEEAQKRLKETRCKPDHEPITRKLPLNNKVVCRNGVPPL